MHAILNLTDCLALYRREHDKALPEWLLTALIDFGVLPVYGSKLDSGDSRFVLRQDFEALLPFLGRLAHLDPDPIMSKTLFGGGIPSELPLAQHTSLEILTPDIETASPFSAAVRHLLLNVEAEGSDNHARIARPFLNTARIVTSSSAVSELANQQRNRQAMLDSLDTGDLAKTAHYMGSKREMASFLVEALACVANDDTVVVDLMCGSGAASTAFSLFWDTIASDSQEFCRLLAAIQGSGFPAAEATRLLEHALPIAEIHLQELATPIEGYLEQEDALLNGEINERAIADYMRFSDEFPTYPASKPTDTWDPVAEIQYRQTYKQKRPYCLFLSYFANVYFGVRQCIEIDSIRYAIDSIDDRRARDMALGALTISLSEVGSTYAAHFAQPALSSRTKPTTKQLSLVLEKRALSVMHEFSVRLLNLAKHGERMPRPIVTVPGPWEHAIESIDSELQGRDVIVYLDAPYKRDEYSRYYHVLETAVKYDYPHSIGNGRIPDIKRRERFKSEFATRNRSRLESCFANLIEVVLSKGWTCAWSYSDSGEADPLFVVEQVAGRVKNVKVRSFSTPYVHRSQGGRKSKMVMECLLIFQPDS